MNDALFDALKRLAPVEGRRAIVLLTDGRAHESGGEAFFPEVVQDLAEDYRRV